MVKQGIVLGHVISERRIEVDKAKVETVEQLPPPTNVKSLRRFLGHAGFYRRFIKDFSKITKPLTQLLQKNVAFDFDEKCLAAFRTLKSALVSAPIIQPPDWSQPLEIMYDASDYTVGAVLGQRKEGRVHAVYYASKTLNEVQLNYATMEKELLVEGPIRRLERGGGGSEWEPIKILLEGDRNSNKMNSVGHPKSHAPHSTFRLPKPDSH
jgi:hypothetical protein